jgi:parallel beta-helix repeat protein
MPPVDSTVLLVATLDESTDMNALFLKTKALPCALSLLALAALTACGGGASDTSTSADSTASESASAEASGSTDAKQQTLAASGKTSTGAIWANAPDSGWTKIATEGQSFTVDGVQDVRYGAGSTWFQMTVTGSGKCTNAFFGGDPAKGLTKQCYAVATSTANPPVTPPPSSTITNPGPGVFVDSVTGNDANPGTFAAPWKTLTKLAGAKVKAGEGIYLMCGSVWRESVSLGTTQLANGAIIAGYGPCSSTSKATISGADNFTGGWTKSGNVWSRSVPTSTPKISRVFVNGEAMRVAQWPNATSATARGFALTDATTVPSTTTLLATSADAAALAGKDIIGAPMKIRHGGAQIDSNTLKAFNSSTRVISLTNAASFSIGGSNGYVLQDKLWMLDAAGEFYHDQAAGKLYVWPASSTAQSNINGVLVEGSVRDVAAQFSNASTLGITNLSTVMARTTGMVIYNAAAASISAINASDNGRSGMQVVTSGTSTGSNGTKVQNSSFARNLVYGLDATSLGGGVLKGNTVSDTGTLAFVGQVQAGIWSGPGTLVDSNFVSVSALGGIRFEGAGGSVLQNNTIVDSCTGFSDCGAIDTWNGPARSNWTSGQLSLVKNNVVARVLVNLEGAGPNAPTFNAAIYLDNQTAYSTVTGNTVLDAPIGIVVHNASYNTIDSNKISRTSQAGLWATMDQTSSDFMVGNVFKNNQIVPVNYATGTFPTTPVPSRSEAIWFWHKLLAEASITSGLNVFSGNDIVQVNDPTIPVAWVRATTGELHMSATAWNQFNPLDPMARSPEQYALYLTNLGPEQITNGGFDTGLGAWTSWFSSATGTRGSLTYGTVNGCTANCGVFAAQTVNDTMISPSFSMKVGGMYRIGFSAAYAKGGTVSKPGISPVTSTGSPVITGFTAATSLAGVTGQTINYEGFFTATNNVPSTVHLSSAAGTTIGFDSVSLREVTGFTVSKLSDWTAYAYAAPSTSKTVDCAALGWPSTCTVTDVNGTPVTLPVTLAAATGKMFLRSDSSFRLR